MGVKQLYRLASAWGVVALVAAAGSTASAQRTARIETGTQLAVRTTDAIDVRSADGRVFTGVVDQDVMDNNGRVAIPRGATVELIARRQANDEIWLDVDSVTINGSRYGVDVSANPVGTAGRNYDPGNSNIGANKETAEHVGGGALLGTIIGGIVGGGKGAAIGAASGAAIGAGTQIYSHGNQVAIPAESLVTFRLNRALNVDIADTGYQQNGFHYHRNYDGY